MASLQTLNPYVAVIFLSLQAQVLSDVVKKGNPEIYDFDYFMRADWHALSTTDNQPLDSPVPYVVIHHTPKLDPCYTLARCTEIMKGLQQYHIGLKWGDIGFNFCVGSEGGVYEGRGWNYKGVHADVANDYSIGICLMGDWHANVPPKLQLDAVKALIKTGVLTNTLDKNYKLIGHHQVTGKECPGKALMKEISTWDHFAPGTHDFTEYIQPRVKENVTIDSDWSQWMLPLTDNQVQYPPWYVRHYW